jgi:hypothetical protein
MSEVILLQEGIEICREIEPLLVNIDYHCALGGSLLYRGTSTKDIDIFIYPHQIKRQMNALKITKHLVNNLKDSVITEDRVGYGDKENYRDKRVIKILYKNRRIDLFFICEGSLL